MIVENGNLVEVSPDGPRKIIKEIRKPVRVEQQVFLSINNGKTTTTNVCWFKWFWGKHY